MKLRGNPNTPLGAEVEKALWGERQRGLRALLQNPLLLASSSEEFSCVRRHAPWLREWLLKEPGWRLQIESDFARLRKLPADTADGSHPARDPKGVVFTRQRYVLLCLALAALERSDRQTTLGQLAREIENLFAAEPRLLERGLGFDLNQRSKRRDLVGVLRFLLQLGVLKRVHGEEELFVANAQRDVLYNVERSVLASLLVAQRGASTVTHENFDERLDLLTHEPMADTDESRNRALRSYLMRRLLEDPVVYYADLSAPQRAYLDGQRSRILREITRATGLIPEVRREGIALVDERDDLTDLRIPEQGTDGHHLLLLAEHLARELRASRASGAAPRVGRVGLESLTSELIRQHQKHWRAEVLEPGAERRMTHSAVAKLNALGLVRLHDDGAVEPLPAIARYALASEPPSSDQEGSLFE